MKQCDHQLRHDRELGHVVYFLSVLLEVVAVLECLLEQVIHQGGSFVTLPLTWKILRCAAVLRYYAL